MEYVGSRSCCILVGKSTDNETSIDDAIFTHSILVHSASSSIDVIKNPCTTTSFRVLQFQTGFSFCEFIHLLDFLMISIHLVLTNNF